MTQRRSPRSKEPKGNTFFGGMAILTFGIMVVKLIGMFYKIPLGEIIGEQGYADFTNAYNIYAVLLTISTAGLPVAVSKMISEASTLKNEAQVERIFKVSLKFFLCFGGISFVIMWFYADNMADMVGDALAAPSIRALAPAVLFVSGVAAFRGYFQGRGQMSPTATSQIIEALCKLVLGLFLAYAIMNLTFDLDDLAKFRPELDITGYSATELKQAIESTQASRAAAGAIMGVTVGTALALVYLMVRFLGSGFRNCGRKGDKADSEFVIIRNLLAIAIPITITTSMSSILNLIDGALVQFQLQSALGMSENESRSIYGSYAMAVNIYNLPISLVTAVTISVIPAVSGALAKKEKKHASTISISALRMTALLALPMGIGLCALGTPIIALLYPTANIGMAGKLLSTLGLVSSFVCLTLVSTSILQVYGFIHLPILITLIGGVIKVLCNFILVGTESFGIYGAPIGYLVCFTFCFLTSYRILQQIVPGLSSIGFSLFFKPAFASAVMGGVAWASYGIMGSLLSRNQRFIDEVTGTLSRGAGGLATVVAISLAGVIYFSLILLLGAVTKEDVLMMPKGEKLVKILHL